MESLLVYLGILCSKYNNIILLIIHKVITIITATLYSLAPLRLLLLLLPLIFLSLN